MSYLQRETPVLAELCTFLVEDLYGELAARVFSILARDGRQTLAAIVRASYLNGRQIKHGLAVLIQQHLLFHSASDSQLNYYEIDWQQSYALVRYGKMLRLVENRFGKKAANVVSNLVTLGHTRLVDLKDAYFPHPDPADREESKGGQTNGTRPDKRNASAERVNGTATQTDVAVNGSATKTNGTANNIPSELHGANGAKANGAPDGGDAVEGVESQDEQGSIIQSMDELYAIIYHLMQQGWIMKVEGTQYLSPGDLHEMARKAVVDEGYGGNNPTGNKDKDQLAALILQRKRYIRDEWSTVPKFPTRKRQALESDYGRATKRLKVSSANEWSSSRDDVAILDAGYANGQNAHSDLVIRVNPEKVAVGMRTEQLADLVEQRLGATTAQIYRVMLYSLEKNVSRCFEEWPDRINPDPDAGIDASIDHRLLVTARDVAKQIDRSIDLFEGLDPHAVMQVIRKGHVDKHNCLTLATDPYNISLDDRTKIIDKHIQLLSDDPFHFVTWHSRDGYSQWRVEFEEITKAIIQQQIENTIAGRKGALGVKLIRALKKKGKLDERQTCNTMMMSAQELRGFVNDMTVQGLIQTQEVPRVERREAKHSMHLIWYDRQRAREKLLHDAYKSMIRILQRIASERGKVQELLAKAARTDVVGNEEKWLSRRELAGLRQWKELHETLLLQLFREDDLVASLRDFIGPLISP
ncbi:DNA directed RNA polymeras-like protein III subunit Rpc82 [Melanomma pulvis-pyrius CBS 109.77]|uniref:DNA-directed RNA polymerase III subunit RPC3 n=1 Tax=Melanomma pulvis-pyrius CBS 109.77 TaxID=1314802 RepID=A0A6A6WVS7_9PLEO|nr:DNA directed RNA polymeras-like protein III subunit Rpc82 [Melanomma pulvis-pyrius CBS 109.77]